jgi:hypothetical protein
MGDFMKKWLVLLLMTLFLGGLIGCSNNANNASKNDTSTKQKNVESIYPAYKMEGIAKKWGYINKAGKFVIEPQYDSAENFMNNGLAKVELKDKVGIIDRSGKIIVGFDYSSIEDYQDGVAVADAIVNNTSKGYCILDEFGKIIFNSASIIGTFSDGLASFSNSTSNDSSNYTYGYVDKAGKVVIEPKYKMAGDFINGKAIVKIDKGSYGVIDKTGNLLKQLNYDFLYSLSEDAICYSQKDEHGVEKYGFISTDGKVLIEAKFKNDTEFKNGLAIVCVGDSEDKYGVIDKKGNYIIPPQYANITEIGGGLYGVSEYNEDYIGYEGDYIKQAIFNSSGKKLTDFKYYDFNWISNNEISVSDDKETYLVDENGEKSKLFQGFIGVGTISKLDNIYKVEMDENDLYYYDTNGKEFWKSDNTIALGDELSVKQHVFRPDRCTIVKYPEINGLTDKNLQANINKKLKQNFVGSIKISEMEDGMYTDDLSIDYSIEKNKDLLIVTYDQYDYPLGAAHGQPDREEFHINLKNGMFYKLEDLFKKDSNFETILTDKVKTMMEKANKEEEYEKYTMDEKDLELGSFIIKKDALCIYYAPYEIASYAEGFPEFDIPYKDIMDIINTDGEFWNSFNKDINGKLSSDENDNITSEEKVNINEFMKGYENGIISAIKIIILNKWNPGSMRIVTCINLRNN